MKVTKRADGRYYTTVTLNGIRRSLYGRTPAEVEAKWIEARTSGGPVTGRTTLADYLSGWLADQANDPRLAANTVDAYRWAVGHLQGMLGRYPLRDLTRAPIQRAFDAKARDLSSNSCRRLYEVLRGALADARADRLITGNPLERVTLREAVARERPVIDPPLARRIVAAVSGHRLSALYVVTLALGLRQGEALGLCWDCVDLGNQTVTLRRQAQPRPGGVVLVERLKSRKSATVLPLNRVAMEALKEHHRRQQHERDLAPEWEREDIVFATERGRLLQGTVAGHILERLCRDAGLPHITFHGLRHGSASLLAAADVHPSVLGDVLRHSDPRTTLRVYTHTTLDARRAGLRKLDDALREETTG